MGRNHTRAHTYTVPPLIPVDWPPSFLARCSLCCRPTFSARMVHGGSQDFHVFAPASSHPVVRFFLRETSHDLRVVSRG